MSQSPITNTVELWDVVRVRGGFGMPFIKDIVETASSKKEADEIVKQYRKIWGNVYHKKRMPA